MNRAFPQFLAAATLALGVAAAPRSPSTSPAPARRFPYPIYAKWAEAYKTKTGIGMNYQSIGSGGGIAQIKAKTVDFGASDMPLKPEDLQEAGLMQFPAIIGGVVPVVNIEGIAPGAAEAHRRGARRHLPRQDQEVERHGDRRAQPRRQAAATSRSPSCVAPTARARRSSGPTTCRRSAPSGRPKVGAGTAVAWPEGVGGKGNEGVAAYVQRIKGSIGYVEYAYAKQNKMAHAPVQNKDGAVRAARRHERSRPPPRTPTGRTRRASTRSSPTSPARRRGRSPARASS